MNKKIGNKGDDSAFTADDDNSAFTEETNNPGFVHQAIDKVVPQIVFPHTSFDFGTVDEGEVIKIEYSFKNAGKSPLIISNARGSAGRAKVEYPKDPILPGGKNVITVYYNTDGKPGKVKVSITVESNSFIDVSISLALIGEVLPK